MTSFPQAARVALRDEQLRRNLHLATTTIRGKRAAVVGERSDWQELREAGEAIKRRVLRHLDHYLVQFEGALQRAGGVVHWASHAEEANHIIVGLVLGTGTQEVVKVKSLTTDELGINDALAGAGISAIETDLAELICQLAGDRPSHILVPAIHKNKPASHSRTDRPWAKRPHSFEDDVSAQTPMNPGFSASEPRARDANCESRDRMGGCLVRWAYSAGLSSPARTSTSRRFAAGASGHSHLGS